MSVPALRSTTHTLNEAPPSGDCSEFQTLFEALKRREGLEPQLICLFGQLNSQDEPTVQKAEEEIKYLQDEFSFHTIALRSFPLWPVDATALKQIALDHSESRHHLLRKRSFHACECLVTYGMQEGCETATALASKKMRSTDEIAQKEGLAYFTLLLNKWHPDLSRDDLVLAISIAKKICTPDQWVDAYHFFSPLVDHGQEEDIARLKETMLDLCASDNFHAWNVGFRICDKIAYRHKNLVEIPLQAAILACASEDAPKRGQGWELFLGLLRMCPALTMDPLLQALEVESKRKHPQNGMLGMLNELASHDFSSLFHEAKTIILQRAEKDAPALLQILTNLSKSDSSYFQQQALKWKQMVEGRIKQAQEKQ